MSKNKKSSNLELVKPSIPWMALSTAKLEKNTDQTVASIPQKQIFSQELILRLTDRIKEI
ncbi:MAG: hypothetical protein ACK2U1_19320 [Anaerolineales bacterium]|jgi:hypothetical protein